ncbi:hypothetical protein AB1N83_000330 [Pleurotus pulmonarius]
MDNIRNRDGAFVVGGRGEGCSRTVNVGGRDDYQTKCECTECIISMSRRGPGYSHGFVKAKYPDSACQQIGRAYVSSAWEVTVASQRRLKSTTRASSSATTTGALALRLSDTPPPSGVFGGLGSFPAVLALQLAPVP